MVTMVINLVTDDNSYKLALNIYRRYKLNGLSKTGKEKLILDLYNEGKTYKQIAETVRVSPRDIKPVLEKAEKEREKELGIYTHEGNDGSTGNQNQTQKKTSTSSQAYGLFSEGKTPLEVAIELNLKEPEATKYQQ
jgi:DNA-binding CsgD family transcriptional regulator